MVTIDEIARDPSAAARLSAAERNMLIARCAAVVMVITSATIDTAMNQPQEQAATVVQDERLLSIEEVAARLKLSKAYTYELARRGEIRALHHGRCWRVRPAELERFIAANEKTRT